MFRSRSRSRSRSPSRSRSSRSGSVSVSGSGFGTVISFLCGQLTSNQGAIWRITTYILISYIAITHSHILPSTNLAHIQKTYQTYNNNNNNNNNNKLQQLNTIQTQAQQEARIQDILMLGGRLSEFENRLLQCSDAKTLYRKEWGKMYCEKYHKGPRGGYCVSKDVKADNEILCVPVANSIISLIGPTATVYDFGCGVGQYGKYWTTHSNITWTGFDGAEGIEEKTDNWVKFLDLTEATYMPRRDWSISLEVGEHIPEAYQDIFLDNLHRHNTKGIILTWGIPGQRGTNHINLRENGWVISKLDALGYDYLEEHSKQTRKLVQDTKSLVWFVDTYMAFKRREPPSTV